MSTANGIAIKSLFLSTSRNRDIFIFSNACRLASPPPQPTPTYANFFLSQLQWIPYTDRWSYSDKFWAPNKWYYFFLLSSFPSYFINVVCQRIWKYVQTLSRMHFWHFLLTYRKFLNWIGITTSDERMFLNHHLKKEFVSRQASWGILRYKYSI